MLPTQNRLPTAGELTGRVYLTVEALSRALGRSERTVARMMRLGRLPPRCKIGPKRLGWRLRDILSWLELARQEEWKALHRPHASAKRR
jgi:predicted DNA-binding transcriptional regulator AlpA